MQVDIVLAWLERPYIVLFIVVVLLQMVGEIFVGESPNPTIAFAREMHLGVKPSNRTSTFGNFHLIAFLRK